MINLVLGTDMSKHFSELGRFKARIGSPDFDMSQGADKDLTLVTMFHLADISNGTKNFDLCRKWTDLLFVEFFNQGDREREKGSPISYLMDRTTVNIARAQIGFLDVIIGPAFQAASLILNMGPNLANIEANKQKWTSLFDDYERKMAKAKDLLVDNLEEEELAS